MNVPIEGSPFGRSGNLPTGPACVGKCRCQPTERSVSALVITATSSATVCDFGRRVAPENRGVRVGSWSARAWVVPSPREAGSLKEATMADTTETTTAHTVEVVRYDDPVIITERVAVSAFIAGYTDPTRRSYATDLRIFAGWCHDHGINLLNVKRPHLETFARWMEQEGRMASTIGRRLSTLSSFYRYCQTEDILDKNPALNVRRPKVHDESKPSAWTATNSAHCSCKPGSAISVTVR
jgi:Phage integrase, N-terminal SAM-like domain